MCEVYHEDIMVHYSRFLHSHSSWHLVLLFESSMAFLVHPAPLLLPPLPPLRMEVVHPQVSLQVSLQVPLQVPPPLDSCNKYNIKVEEIEG